MTTLQSHPLRMLTLVVAIACSGCTWFGSKKTLQESPQIVVTGAPVGSLLWVDGEQIGSMSEVNDRPRVLPVAAGSHQIEVHVGETVVFREAIYVGRGEIHTVQVLSGLNR